MTSLETAAAFDALYAGQHPAWVFKHSRICPTSTFAKLELDEYVAMHPDHLVGFLVVQDARDVSNHVAEVTGVRHESPQALLVAEGRVLWHASHGRITADAMSAAMADARD